jgi:hypothetical protein
MQPQGFEVIYFNDFLGYVNVDDLQYCQRWRTSALVQISFENEYKQ